MAFDAFIKIKDLPGDSVKEGHVDEIEVLSWSWGMTQTGTMHKSGTGGGAGRADVQDLSFVHYVDSATPNLMAACLKGKHFDEAVLTVNKAAGEDGKPGMTYLTITMKEMIVSSVQTGGGSGDELITENVTLNFGEVEVSYQKQDSKGGKKGGSIDVTHSIAKNK